MWNLPYIYKVRCTGKIIILNSDIYTDLIIRYNRAMNKWWGGGRVEDVIRNCENYWTPDHIYDSEKEALVEGSVVVTHQCAK